MQKNNQYNWLFFLISLMVIIFIGCSNPKNNPKKISSNIQPINNIQQEAKKPEVSLIKEPIPRAEFIKITDEVLSSLNMVDSAFSSSDTKVFEARSLLTKLKADLQKYKNYYDYNTIDDWPENSSQGKIVKTIGVAWANFEVVLFGIQVAKSYDPNTLIEAQEKTNEVRKLFRNYIKG